MTKFIKDERDHQLTIELMASESSVDIKFQTMNTLHEASMSKGPGYGVKKEDGKRKKGKVTRMQI